tara:strand:- start:1065 stop:1343 length:279 start_codon:yes stop_codon:yes gene_type:complete
LRFEYLWLVVFRVKGDEHHEQQVHASTEKAKGLKYENKVARGGGILCPFGYLERVQKGVGLSSIRLSQHNKLRRRCLWQFQIGFTTALGNAR